MTGPGSQIILPAKRVAAGKSDDRVGALLALARAANAITIARGPLVVPLENETPATARERFSALFYVAGILHEALHTAEVAERRFSMLESWQKGFGELLGDTAVVEFRKRSLKRFRDKGTFHFDAGFFERAVSRWPSEDVVLASLTSNRVEDIYFSVADDLLFSHILGPFDTDAALVTAFSEFSSMTIAVMNRFLEAVHRLVPGVFAQLGAERRHVV